MASVIWIENLSPAIDASRLCALFGKYGRILSAGIEYDKNLRSLQKGFVCFDSIACARHAVFEMNKQKMLGKPMSVYLETTEKNSSKDAYYTKIFVKNLDLDWDECNLIKEFDKFGEIIKAHISDTDGKSNGYGFVSYRKHSSAKAAVEAMHGKIVSGKKLNVQRFMDKDVRERTTPDSLDTAREIVKMNTQLNNLHIKNLPKTMTEEELEELFDVFGSIQSVKIVRDEANQSKGFGFVCFCNEEDADKAFKKMQNYSYNSKILEVNFFQKKAARQQYLNMMNSDVKVRKFEKNKETVPKDSKHPVKNSFFSFTASQ